MRIDLIAPPYSGHLHPVLAMACQLTARHQVRVLSTPSAMAQVARAGLVGVPLLDADAERVLDAISDPRHAVRNHPLRMHRQLRAALDVMARFARALRETYADAATRPGLVIADFTVPAAGAVAQSLGIRWWTSLPSPSVLEAPDGPPAYMGGLSPATHAGQRLQHALARLAVRGFKRGVHRAYRHRMTALGLPRLYRDDGSEAVYSPERILALGIDALEFPRTWPAALRFIGPQLPTPGTDTPWSVPRREPRFVEGRRHVLVTLGTHLSWAKNAFDARLRALAAAMPDVEFHFTDGDAAADHHDHTGNYQRLAYVDYARWIGRYDLVVHHGGAGILYQCLAAGRPAIVCPQDYDQFDHAARLEHARAALWLRDPAGLEVAVRRAFADPELFDGLPALQAAARETTDAHPLVTLVADDTSW
ncbi:glycosyltransferase [Luteimonas terrae]|uniref:UDP:flavonoid glycosyltransferase YjiC (YdhE family) n=1 Tax=Luteimonas terrae TaxID=1530191 RepID=A0ABU1XSY9_9GAMM|nr:glycosyltransferase [Luteimonas terrae]MDR7191877.1 UDP:flavonoid glycosyltransferase YjiC (YdhE family) [Luteimonas terrae]